MHFLSHDNFQKFVVFLAIKMAAYEEIITPVYTLFCPIISIGNISMGYKTLFEQMKTVSKIVVPVGMALCKSFSCRRLVLGLSSACPHLSFLSLCCLYNVLVLPCLCPRLLLKSLHIPYAVFSMTFFPWKDFSKEFELILVRLSKVY